CRNPTWKKSSGGMEHARKIIVLIARPWKRRRKFGIGERPAQGHQAPHHPEHQQRKSRWNVPDLKTEACEHAGSDHVCHGKGRRRDPRPLGNIEDPPLCWGGAKWLFYCHRFRSLNSILI